MCWAAQAGITEAEELAYNPEAPSGHFGRHLKSKLPQYGKRAHERLYTYAAPSYSRGLLGRSTHIFTNVLAHEEVIREVNEDPMMMENLKDAVDEQVDLPKAYCMHPIVQRFLAYVPVIPLALFVDGVPYSLNDSVVGFWLLNLISGKRTLLAIVRKKLTCRCGCRGWCTFFSVWDIIAWSFRQLAKGVLPAERHDGTPFGEGERHRAGAGAEELPFRAVLVYLKCDWAEFGTTCGLATWSSNLRPCWVCPLFGALLYEDLLDGTVDADGVGAYERACARCEIWVVLSRMTHAAIARALAYDKRTGTNSSKGLALTEDVPSLGLRRGDRLEPWHSCPDVSAVFSMDQFPAPLLFWRPSCETVARHRNPIFDDSLGTDLSTTATIDSLHAVYLGVMKDFCCQAIWWVLLAGLWSPLGTLEEVVETTVVTFKHELHAFYRRYHAQHFDMAKLTEVHDVTQKMLGSNTDRKLKTKGAETWGVLLFLEELFSANGRAAALGPETVMFHEAAQALANMCRFMSSSGACLDDAECETLLGFWKRFVALTDNIPELKTPKRHTVFHMCHRAGFQGNPKVYANWEDESANRVLKAACRTLSQATFEETVLMSMPTILEYGGRRRA